MTRLPRRYAPYIFGVIQAALTTGVATAIATPLGDGEPWAYVSHWTHAWTIAWVSMLPIVIGLAPLIRRAVDKLTAPEPLPGVLQVDTAADVRESTK